MTYHAVYNFGANLQALSTYSYLKNEGHEPIVIDFFPRLLEVTFDNTIPFVQANKHKQFVQKHFRVTKRCRDSNEIAAEIEQNDIEAVIIGSDAVVQHYSLLSRIRIIPSRKKILIIRVDPIRYETNLPNPFWGEFIDYIHKSIPVVMMSVSCQNTEYRLFSLSEKKLIAEYIKKLRFISVRDRWTQNLFKHVSSSSSIPKITPDPVFAFNYNVRDSTSKEEILRKFNLPDNYILLSFNSSKTVINSWVSLFESKAMKLGYQCVALAMPGGINFTNDIPNKINVPLDPLDWYNIIKYSSGYVGEKMHPIIVCLHNSVPFYCFDHYGILRFKLFLNQKASKIYHILERAGFDDFRISIARKFGYDPPAPDHVLNKLVSFNKASCSLFAEQMVNEYKQMMTEIMDKLKTD